MSLNLYDENYRTEVLNSRSKPLCSCGAQESGNTEAPQFGVLTLPVSDCSLRYEACSSCNCAAELVAYQRQRMSSLSK